MLNELLTNEIVKFGVPFLVGLVAGFVLGRKLGHKVEINEGWEKTMLLFMISGIWIVSSVVSTFGPDETPTFLHILMGAVVGYYFEVDILGYFTKGKKNEKKDS